MKPDRFWESFWLIFFAFALLSLFSSAGLFFYNVNKLNAAAVGISFDPAHDPFESHTTREKISLTNGYMYRDSLPVGISQWGWDSTTDWNSADNPYEGGYSIHTTFEKEWGGFGMNGFLVSTSSYHSLSLAVRPSASVGDLYIELYDQNGVALPRQSLGWYAPGGALVLGQWQYLTIPLQNLVGSSGTTAITGVSISTKEPGDAYIDAIQFTTNDAPHDVWVAPKDGDWAPFNPFATSTPLSLPYTADFSALDFSRWYSYYGTWQLGDASFKIGPKAASSTDSISIIRGGRAWSDYHVNATLNWGATSAFSLLTRFTDSGNFASCAFSEYGQGVIIYQVKNGVSTDLGESPTLPIPTYAPWENVKVGAEVAGNRVSCFVNGEKVISAAMPTLPATGTAGIEAWDPNVYASPHSVTSFTVRQLLGE